MQVGRRNYCHQGAQWCFFISNPRDATFSVADMFSIQSLGYAFTKKNFQNTDIEECLEHLRIGKHDLLHSLNGTSQ